MVVPKGLFVQVPEEMERLYAHVGAIQSPFQETPEVLQSISVNLAIYIFPRWPISPADASALEHDRFKDLKRATHHDLGFYTDVLLRQSLHKEKMEFLYAHAIR